MSLGQPNAIEVIMNRFGEQLYERWKGRVEVLIWKINCGTSYWENIQGGEVGFVFKRETQGMGIR